MMRIRLSTGRGTLFLAALVVALIALLPMRLALAWFGLAEAGMSAREVRGSIWSGALTEARFGDIALGDLSAHVSPLQLLLGRARVSLAAPDSTGAARVTGAIDVTRHSVGLNNLTASLPVGSAFAPVPVRTLELEGVNVGFTDDSCTHADGRVRAVLSGDVAGQPIPPSMSGTPRCDAGALLLPLTSPAGEGSTIRIWPDGRYHADLTLAGGDPARAARLQASGFVETQHGWQLAIEGRF
ncbi:type II secretion system protein N [Sphingomonas sp. TX0543]|uniref:type II secretion system protein N n=1 Tax=unclassified Sphingomonas TaxID=196159 RepID=UPI0010F65811|nr:type II secretion system protein N [Sphingomonas sp. 3P27F8]